MRRSAIGGRREWNSCTGTFWTLLQGLIDDLDSRHAGIKGRLITDEGNLHRFVNVYVNDEDVRFLGSLGTPLKDGDSVTVLPAVAGG